MELLNLLPVCGFQHFKIPKIGDHKIIRLHFTDEGLYIIIQMI